MSDLSRLQASCRSILARHQGGFNNLDLICVVCQQRVRGQENSMQHYITAHGIHTTHFDNVADLAGFLAHLRELLFPNGGCDDNEPKVFCPVCREECCSLAAWEAHVRSEGHNRWDIETIPTLSPFCVVGGSCNNDDEDGEDKAHSGDECDDEDEEESDFDVEPVVCLLCDTVSGDCLGHMMEAHAFDFRAAIRAHEGVHDEYDVIRIVNAIRKSVAQGDCPYHYGMQSTETEECRRDVAASSLMAHVQTHLHHIIPRMVPAGDKELIPVLFGDAFISCVIIGGNLTLRTGDENTKEDEGGEDSDYPMVPTIAEMVRRWAPNAQQPSGHLLDTHTGEAAAVLHTRSKAD